MEDKYSWNLTHIFENEEKFEESVKEVYRMLDVLKTFEGKLGDSVDETYNCLKSLVYANELFEKVYGYAMLKYHQNMADPEASKLYKRVVSIATDFSKAESYISPELSKISDERLEEYLQDDRMKEFDKLIRDVIKEKKHILSSEEEMLLAHYSEIFGAAERAFDVFTNTELEYPSIKDENGEDVKITTALYSKYIMNKNENVRKQAFDAMFLTYKKYINTIAELYLTRVKTSAITSKIRHYESSLDRATNNDDSNVKVYETLVDQMNKHLYLNHDYLALKAKLLNKEKVHMYDVYVNPLDVDDRKVEYEDAKKIVLDALSVMGEDYTKVVKEAMDNNWIDVYEKENKMSGGYSMGIYGVHPYILLNYINSSRDVSTLAHELGHTMHSYFSNKNQNAINANYTIMVAEVASTVNEIILANYLIANEEDKTKKASLINEQLDMIRATLVRQTMFAEFEKIVHSKVEAGESLASDNLNDIYYELVKKYFGDITICDEPIKYEWARIPHFYRCFYVYKYATGITSAIVIASKILSHEEGYVEKYLNMLTKGGSIDSLSLLRMVDVDLEKEETYEIAFKYFENKLNELKDLIN